MVTEAVKSGTENKSKLNGTTLRQRHGRNFIMKKILEESHTSFVPKNLGLRNHNM